MSFVLSSGKMALAKHLALKLWRTILMLKASHPQNVLLHTTYFCRNPCLPWSQVRCFFPRHFFFLSRSTTLLFSRCVSPRMAKEKERKQATALSCTQLPRYWPTNIAFSFLVAPMPKTQSLLALVACPSPSSFETGRNEQKDTPSTSTLVLFHASLQKKKKRLLIALALSHSSSFRSVPMTWIFVRHIEIEPGHFLFFGLLGNWSFCVCPWSPFPTHPLLHFTPHVHFFSLCHNRLLNPRHDKKQDKTSRTTGMPMLSSHCISADSNVQVAIRQADPPYVFG